MKNKSIAQKLITFLLFFSLIILYTPHLFAQSENDELKINIQLRPRAEFRNGLFTPILKGQKPAAFIAQRSRLGLTYTKNKKLLIGLSTQVVTTWGNDPQVQAVANDISLYEAWAQLYFNPEWNIKIGRQILSYDDERILGALDWNNAGRKHDAVVLGFKNDKFQANLGGAFNQNAEKVNNTFFDNSNSQPYKAMEFLWMKYKFSDAIGMSIITMNLDLQSRFDSSVSHLQTLGGNVFYNKGKVNAMGTGYYQTGRNQPKNLSTVKTSAWMAAVKADYSFNKKFSLGIGSDYLSGRDMNSKSSNISYFNPLYGTGHKFYGSMDYFYVSSAHNNVGLWDSYVNINLNAAERLSWHFALHHFESAANVIDYSGSKASSSLGNEADISFNYKIMDGAKLSGGYSQMFTDPSMKYVKRILPNQEMKSIQNWVWLSININPDVLIYKFKSK
jgi:hypothetical protein